MVLATAWAVTGAGSARSVEIAGLAVVPHADGVAEGLRYASDRGPTDGALVQIFLRNDGPEPLSLPTGVTFGDRTPDEAVAAGAWSWSRR